MKKILLTLFYISLTTLILGQNVGINDDGSAPDNGAILDVKSTSKGILIPRTTTASITAPTEGMMIYDTNKQRFMLYTGSSWYELMTKEDEGPFEKVGSIIRQTGNYDTDDFLFGTPDTAVATTFPYKDILFYDNSTGAFRGGLYESAALFTNMGINSFAYGDNNEADGVNSASFGQANRALGNRSFAFGGSCDAFGANSFAGGSISNSLGFASFSMGKNVTAGSAYEVTLGSYSSFYTPSSTISWVGTDRIFSIGNGSGIGSNTSNALTILKNGKSGFGTTSPEAWIHINSDDGVDLLKLEEDGATKLEFKVNPKGDIYYHANSSNTLLGFAAGEELSSGNGNVMVGSQAGFDVAGGDLNVFVGQETGRDSEGDKNTFLGYGAGASSTGNRNIFIGETAGISINASDRLYIGNSTASSFIYGEFDNKILKINGGLRASEGFEDDDGDTKIQVEEANDDDIIRFDIEGSEKLKLVQNSSDQFRIEILNNDDNTLIGEDAGQNIISTGIRNTAIGNRAGESINSGDLNTLIGDLSGATIQGGQFNAMLGATSGQNNTGSNNTFIGTGAGSSSGAASGSVYIGRNVGQNATVSNRLYIDNTSTSQPLIYGEFSNDEVEINGDLSIDVHIGATENTGELRFKDGGITEYSFRHNTNSNYFYLAEDVTSTNIFYAEDENFGIKRRPTTNDLEVNGTASKSTAGDWLANSDARLKKNITPLSPEDILAKMTSLQGITYEWNDNRPETGRPDGIQYGFTAQNIQEVFPTLVTEDAEGFLQTAYGTYDAMYVESIKALLSKIDKLENENKSQVNQIISLQESLSKNSNLLRHINQRLASLEINN